MHIGIDCRLYGIKHAGIGRYVQNLVLHLGQIDSVNHYTLVTSKDTKLPPLPHNFSQVTTHIRHYTLAEQLQFSKLLQSLNLDLVHFPHFNVPLLYHRPFIVTIHDLLWHKKIGLNATTLNPLIYIFKYFGYRLVIKNAVYRSQNILTPSQTIKHSVIKTFSIPDTKIHVTPEAPDPIFSKPGPKAKLPPSLNKPFIIYTGSLYPHKNVNTLIDSLHSLPGLNLAISSARNIFERQTRAHARQAGLISRVKFLGYVPDSKLVGLYQQAIALIQPSLSEGFGLTGLEAMAVGLPVICSHHPVLKEIYGSAALFTDTSSPSHLSYAISRLHQDIKLRNKFIKLGKIQARIYSWDKMAHQTLKVYQQSITNHSSP